MRKLFVVSSLVASMTTLFLLMGATASASFESSTYVGCDSQAATPVPSHVCEIGDSPGGYLKANEDVEYDICTEHPSGETICEEHQNSFANILFGNVITAKEVGQYQVYWWQTEEHLEIGSWAFEMKAAGAPPPPKTTPESPSTTSPGSTASNPVPSGPSTACVAAKARTKTLSAKLKKAGQKQKPKIKKKLRKARTAVGSSC